jgi:hypothetical protein
MIELTEDQVQALKAQSNSPLRVLNPRTREVYVLVRQEIYEQASLILDGANRRGWDNPDLDVYEEYRKKT